MQVGLWQQDSDLCESWKVAREVWEYLLCKMFSQGAGSPGINLIENMFNVLCQQLKHNTLELAIKHET